MNPHVILPSRIQFALVFGFHIIFRLLPSVSLLYSFYLLVVPRKNKKWTRLTRPSERITDPC
jgi:cytochrome bd-type quinol oxidase subunit 1